MSNCFVRTLAVGSSMLQDWRRQIGGQRHRRFRRGPRTFAVLSYLTTGPVIDGLVELGRISFCVLHDYQQPGVVATRLAGYRATIVSGRILIGGAAQIRFEKNIALSPAGERKRGCRLGKNGPELLSLALHLDRTLERYARFPFFPRRSAFRMPRFWVALADQSVRDRGPAFAAYCKMNGHSPGKLFKRAGRDHAGLIIYPLEFVSHYWQQFGKVYVDLKSFPKRQIICFRGPADLKGLFGVCEFDLLSSRFRTVAPNCTLR